jgi:succinate dehydrogenase hydrophobic anchor subunit
MQINPNAEEKNKWLFSKPLEILYQIVPILILPFAFYEIFARPNWGNTEIMWTRFVANTFLLNSLHVVLTFALILGSSALRNWVRENYKISIRQWLLRVSGILTLFLVLFWAAGAHFVVQEKWRQPFCFLLILAGVIAPHFHSIWQIRGISTLYDQGNTSYLERYLINILFLFFTLSQIARLLIEFPNVLTIFGPYVSRLQQLPLDKIRLIGTLLGLLAAGGVIVNSILRKGLYMKRRSFFLLRLFLFPLGTYSFMALAGTSAAHGLEYLAVFWKVSGTQPKDEKNKIRKYGILSMILLIPFMMPIYGVFWSIFPKNNFLEFISALGIAIVYTHYIVDGALYRMKDPVTRKIVGPMLIEKN